MKTKFQRIGLAKLCVWFGVTRQAFYKNSNSIASHAIEDEIVLQMVREIRSKHMKIGTRKLYSMIAPELASHDIKMGRDGLFKLLTRNNLLIRKRKRRITTTYSSHWLRKYPNLIKGHIPIAPNTLWVSDITYWKINASEHFYISFITDAYSHKIVGHHVANTLEAIESIQALKNALSALGAGSIFQLTHHSDRGIQYCSSSYVKLLEKHDINISMTENGDPLENALAERINGIIKDEYLENHEVKNLKEAKKLLDIVVDLYNNERPHMSISNLTPNVIHHSKDIVETKRLWKNYYQKKHTFVNQIQD
jgi:putative transposase